MIKYLLPNTLKISENLNLSSSEVSFLSVVPDLESNLASIATKIAHRIVPAKRRTSPANAGLAVSWRV